eukprot:2004691-Prymnesium_polylepis.1
MPAPNGPSVLSAVKYTFCSLRYNCTPYLRPSPPIGRRRDIYDTPLLLCPASGADAVSAAPCSLASQFGQSALVECMHLLHS